MVSRFADRLDEATYRFDEPVSIFVAREGAAPEQLLSIPGRLFSRIQLMADAYDLHTLPVIDPYRRTHFNLAQTQSLGVHGGHCRRTPAPGRDRRPDRRGPSRRRI